MFIIGFFWEYLGGFDWLFEWERKRGKPLKGGWNSLAGQLAIALHPRAKTTGVLQVLQLTERRLHVVYVQHGRQKGDIGVVEPGWSTDVRQVAWLRDRTAVYHDTYEIGFEDGSWVRVWLRGPELDAFLACFPYRLRHTDPVP
ncbi:hypothetical protein [Streptomyces sp. KR80]|uniref:hypothetical protein n=1 Tax=Streptomyces sp. KR80 TaxID=3457426 RepID=UPI003FD08070